MLLESIILMEAGRNNQKKQKKLWPIAAAVCVLLALVIGTVVWSNTQAAKKKSEMYTLILSEANDVQDYYDAIMVEPGWPEAYLQMNAFLTSDYDLSREEAQQINRLLIGLEMTDQTGRTKTIPVLDELKKTNGEAYSEVCFKFGWSFCSYYLADDCERYSAASKWLRTIRDNGTEEGEIAAIICDISECIDATVSLRDSKVVQTEDLREQRQKLWDMVQNLMKKAENYATNFQLLVWENVLNVIDTYTVDFLYVAEPAQLIQLLRIISDNSELRANSDPEWKEYCMHLKAAADETIARLTKYQG